MYLFILFRTPDDEVYRDGSGLALCPAEKLRSLLSGSRRGSGGVAAGNLGPPGHLRGMPTTDAPCRSEAK